MYEFFKVRFSNGATEDYSGVVNHQINSDGSLSIFQNSENILVERCTFLEISFKAPRPTKFREKIFCP